MWLWWNPTMTIHNTTKHIKIWVFVNRRLDILKKKNGKSNREIYGKHYLKTDKNMNAHLPRIDSIEFSLQSGPKWSWDPQL